MANAVHIRIWQNGESKTVYKECHSTPPPAIPVWGLERVPCCNMILTGTCFISLAAIRPYVLEILAPNVYVECFGSVSNSPDILLFVRFKRNWSKVVTGGFRPFSEEESMLNHS